MAKFSDNRNATASFWASELDRNNFGWQIVTGTCVGRPFKFGFHGSKVCYALAIATFKMNDSSATFKMNDWTVTVRGMRSVFRAEDYIAGPKNRLDISFTARGGAPSRDKPHGIIGQSYTTIGRVRNGKMDVYPWEGGVTTSAMAEGAIEGTAPDYEMASAHATDFASASKA